MCLASRGTGIKSSTSMKSWGAYRHDTLVLCNTRSIITTTTKSVSFSISVAPPSRLSRVVRTVLKGAMCGLLGYACFWAGRGVGRALLSLPTVQSLLQNIRTPSVWPFFYLYRLSAVNTNSLNSTGCWLGEEEDFGVKTRLHPIWNETVWMEGSLVCLLNLLFTISSVYL